MATKRLPSRIIEITASVSAVIPTGNYENFKPMYSVKEIVKANGNADAIISQRTDELRALLGGKLAEDYEKMRIERIKQQRQDLRLEVRNGKTYPSVTTVIGAIDPINFDPDKLQQYASVGSLVHAQIAHFFKTGVWEQDILKIAGTKADYLIVTQGSLRLNWKESNFMGWWTEYKDRIKVIDSELKVFNDEHIYCGTCDLYCKFDGKLTVLDFKTATTMDAPKLSKAMKQTSAYAKCFKDKVEQLVVALVHQPQNKSGYGKPVIEDKVDDYFAYFLNDRAEFKKIYGI